MIYPRKLSCSGLSGCWFREVSFDRIGGGILSGLVYLAILVLGRIVLRKRWAADLAAVLVFNALAVSGTFIAGNLHMRILLAISFLVPSFTWIPLMRRFGFLAILAVWAFQLAMQAVPLTATGWMTERTMALHLIPVAVAAWALWVIVSVERRPAIESAM